MKNIITLVLVCLSLGVFAQEEKVKDGEFKTYWDDGKTLQVIGNYKDGKKDGEWVSYDYNGGVVEEINYKDGKLDGEWKWYNDGDYKIIRKRNYSEGKEVNDSLFWFHYLVHQNKSIFLLTYHLYNFLYYLSDHFHNIQ